MERGYTFVMVDLRGFGGSSGCLDWVGPGEQADVKAAVEWAATQPWSTGKVGMYGKSYDGVTGLDRRDRCKPQGPRRRSSPRSRSTTCTATCTPTASASRTRSARPALYNAIAATPGPARRTTRSTTLDDDAHEPGCLALNYARQQDDDHDSEYWKAARPDRRRRRAQGRRCSSPRASSRTTPSRTARSGLLQRRQGPQARVVRHVGPRPRQRRRRGRPAADGPQGLVRRGHALLRPLRRGCRSPTRRRQDPPVVVQTSDGTWRAEAAWPPADAQRSTTDARRRGDVHRRRQQRTGTGSGARQRHLDDLPAARRTTRIAGVPRVSSTSTAPAPRANVVVDTYDIDAGPQGDPAVAQHLADARRDGKVDAGPLRQRLEDPGRATASACSSPARNAEWWLHVADAAARSTVNGGVGRAAVPRCTRARRRSRASRR